MGQSGFRLQQAEVSGEMTWSEVLRGKGVRAGGGRSAVSTEPRVDVVAILTAGFR